MRQSVIGLVREPLLHFLLLALAIFVVFDRSPRRGVSASDEIVVNPVRIAGLADKFARTWQRPPNEAELNGLIQDFVREEIAVREATVMGIDRDDTVIRRLLRQRVEFVTEEAMLLAEPSEMELEAYRIDHAEDFRRDTLISFSHVFLDPQRRGASLTADAELLRARLNAGADRMPIADLHELGDTTLLERRFTDYAVRDVARIFGDRFADELVDQEPGEWSAPLESAYGQHLVHVGDRAAGVVPPLAEIRDVVRREWVAARRRATLDAFYAALLQRYRVTVEMPQSETDENQLADSR